MGPGHRQNGGRWQERHLDAAGAQLMSTSVGRADLAGWCWCGGGLASWWGLSGAGGDLVGQVGTREENEVADGLGAFMGAGGAAVGDGVQVLLVLGWGLAGDAVGLSWGTR